MASPSGGPPAFSDMIRRYGLSNTMMSRNDLASELLSLKRCLRTDFDKILNNPFFKHGAFLDQVDGHTEPDAALTLLLNANDELINSEERELVRRVLNGYRRLRKRTDVTTAIIDDFYQTAVALYQAFGLHIATAHEESNKRDEMRAKKTLRAKKFQEFGEEKAGAVANPSFEDIQQNVEAASAAKPMSKQAKKNAKEKERKKRKKAEQESKDQGVSAEE